MKRSSALFLASLLLVSGCATIGGRPPAAGRSEVGLASYYARKFEGRRTASGERYDAGEMTAAHRTLEFGTRVRVTRLDDGRQVEVRINDRGPWVEGRVIDLSRRAAERLDIVRAGTARVRVEVVGD